MAQRNRQRGLGRGLGLRGVVGRGGRGVRDVMGPGWALGRSGGCGGSCPFAVLVNFMVYNNYIYMYMMTHLLRSTQLPMPHEHFGKLIQQGVIAMLQMLRSGQCFGHIEFESFPPCLVILLLRGSGDHILDRSNRRIVLTGRRHLFHL